MEWPELKRKHDGADGTSPLGRAKVARVGGEQPQGEPLGEPLGQPPQGEPLGEPTSSPSSHEKVLSHASSRLGPCLGGVES